MYVGNNNNSKSFDMLSYVKGNDIFNSRYLSDLDALSKDEDFLISSSPTREDLIAKEIYGDPSYMGILSFIGRRTSEELSVGDSIDHPTLVQLNSLIGKSS